MADAPSPDRPAPDRPGALAVAAVAAGGVLGAAARYAIQLRWPPDGEDGVPWATLTINVTGCLLIGVLMVVVHEAGRGHRLTRPFLGVGVLGGYTTFSAYVMESHTLLGIRPAAGLAYLAATPLLAVAATLAGALAARAALGRR